MAKRGRPVLKLRIPDGVSVAVEGDLVTVSHGEKSLSKRFSASGVKVKVEGDEVIVSSMLPRKKLSALAGTIRAHVANMVEGVTEGFEYRMKIVYSHFPMKVRVEDGELLVDNFLGEKHPRRAKLVGLTEVEVKGDTLILRGPDVEAVGQSAANVERATKVKGYDQRVFQDGIYLVSKTPEEV
jgi:large subunit ribosomal protein L6